MAWSLSFTSKMGLVKDSFHRIPLVIDIAAGPVDVHELDKVEKLVSSNMKHLFFRLSGDCSENGCKHAVQSLRLYLERLHDANLTFNAFVTVYLTDFEFIRNSELVDYLCQKPVNNESSPSPSAMSIGCIVVSLLGAGIVEDKESSNYHGVISQFGSVKEAIRQRSDDIKIGIADVYHRKTLQHLYEAYPGEIAVAIPGDSQLPNLRCRNIEYIHSQGCNIFLLFDSETLPNLDREHVPTLEDILDEYTMAKGNIDTLLVKMLLQYGPMVCVGIASLSLEYLKEHFAFMCDPFTYRTAQQAPTVIKRFQVAKSHVDDLILQSEEIECKEDEHWTRNYLHAVPPRKLTNENEILQGKIELARKFDHK